MTMFLRLRHEARRAGAARWLAPLTALVVAAGMALLGVANGAPTEQVDRLLLVGLEAVLPLAVGVAAPALIARDSCRELQLSLPTRYGATLGRRLAVLAGWSCAAALAYTAGLWLLGRWEGPSGPAGSLVWLAPALWLGSLGVVIVLVSRSAAVATTVVGGVWLIEQLLADSIATHPVGRHLFLFTTTRVGHAEGWLTNRIWLLVSAGLLAAVAVVILSRPDRLLSSEED